MSFVFATLVAALFTFGGVAATDLASDQSASVPSASERAPSASTPASEAVVQGWGGGCPAQAYPAETGGCRLTARTPADCATISLPAEFAWEGDACHTPYYLQIGGNPPEEWNYREFQISSVVNASAWAEPVGSSYLEGLYTSDGWYHWRVCNAYETGCSGSRAFRVQQ